MKRTILSICACLLIASSTMAQKTILIHSNGAIIDSYSTSEIDSILFYPIGYKEVFRGTVNTLCGTTEGIENGSFESAKFLRPVEIAYNPELNSLFLFDDENTNELRVIDIAQKQVSTATNLEPATFGGRITSMAFSKNNDTLFVARDIIWDAPETEIGVFTLTKSENWNNPAMYSNSKTCNSIAVNPVTGELFGNRFLDATVVKINQSPTPDEVMFTVGTEGSDEFRLAWSRDGKTLYTASYYNGAVWKSGYDLEKREFIGDPQPYVGMYKEKGAQEGHGTDARMENPANMITDQMGNLYICDNTNHVVWKVDKDQNMIVWAGQIGATGYVDGMGTEAMFNGPESLALDHATNTLYVVDRFNHKVRIITAE